jgi:hypothetical protein
MTADEEPFDVVGLGKVLLEVATLETALASRSGR